MCPKLLRGPSAQIQNRAPLRYALDIYIPRYLVDVSFSALQICTEAVQLHNTQSRWEDRGDCHRKLRGTNIMLDLTAEVSQRGYKGDLPLTTSKPGKKKKARPTELHPSQACPAIQNPGTLPQGHPAKGPGTAGLTGAKRTQRPGLRCAPDTQLEQRGRTPPSPAPPQPETVPAGPRASGTPPGARLPPTRAHRPRGWGAPPRREGAVVGSYPPLPPPHLAQAASPHAPLVAPGKARWFVPSPPPALTLGSARAPPPSPPERRAQGALPTEGHVDLLQAVAAAVPDHRRSRGARKRRRSPEPAHDWPQDHRRLPSLPQPLPSELHACAGCGCACAAALPRPGIGTLRMRSNFSSALAAGACAEERSCPRSGAGALPPAGREEQVQRGVGARGVPVPSPRVASRAASPGARSAAARPGGCGGAAGWAPVPAPFRPFGVQRAAAGPAGNRLCAGGRAVRGPLSGLLQGQGAAGKGEGRPASSAREGCGGGAGGTRQRCRGAQSRALGGRLRAGGSAEKLKAR